MTSVYILLTIFLLVQACDKKGDQSQASKDDTVRTQTASPDSTPKVQPAEPGLPPGQAKLQATVSEIHTHSNTSEVVFVVEKVLGYGSSTPPVPVGDTLSYHIKEETYTDLSLNKQQKVSLIIQRKVTLKSSQNDGWSLIKVLK
jgi:hypothetical protein